MWCSWSGHVQYKWVCELVESLCSEILSYTANTRYLHYLVYCRIINSNKTINGIGSTSRDWLFTHVDTQTSLSSYQSFVVVRGDLLSLPGQVPHGGVDDWVAFSVSRWRQRRVFPHLTTHQAMLVPLPPQQWRDLNTTTTTTVGTRQTKWRWMWD